MKVMKWKSMLGISIVAAFLAAGGGAALAATTSGNHAGAGQGSIVGTDHDLSATGGATATSTATTEICVWCHTPHGANTNFTGSDSTTLPLWNKPSVASTVSFTMYTPVTSGITVASSPDSISLACLSCHDGVSAVNALVLTPQNGSTGDFVYNATGTDEEIGGQTSAQSLEGAAFGLTANVYDLTSNLSSTHPISVTWPSGSSVGLAGLGATTDSLNPAGTNYGGWLGVPTGTGTIASLLNTSSQVTCASCHDPHNNLNGDFLRISNTGSHLCLTCHSQQGGQNGGGL